MNLTKHFTHCGYLKSQFEKGLIKNIDQLKNNSTFKSYSNEKKEKCLNELKNVFETKCNFYLTGEVPTQQLDEIRNKVNPYCYKQDKKKRKETLTTLGKSELPDDVKQSVWNAQASIEEENGYLDIINEYLNEKHDITKTKSLEEVGNEKIVTDVQRSVSAPSELGSIQERTDPETGLSKKFAVVGGKKQKTRKNKKKGKKKTMKKKGKKKTMKKKGKKILKKKGKKRTMKKKGKKSRK